MSERFNDLFVATQCPSQQQLLDYVQGRLSVEEQREVEKHITDCELCSDALEGLAAIQQQDRIPVWLRQMKWQLLRKLRKKNRRKRQVEQYLPLILIVIAIIFLMLTAFWMYHFMIK